MNLFLLSTSKRKGARMHCNRHVVKMILGRRSFCVDVRAYGWRGCRKAHQSVSQDRVAPHGDLGAISLNWFFAVELVLLCVPSIRVSTESITMQRTSSFPQAFRLCETFGDPSYQEQVWTYEERLHAFSPGNARRVRGLQERCASRG